MTDNPKSATTRGSGTLLVADRLRELIVSADLKPGERISERLMCEKMEGVSRTPLREAFKVLAAEGLVTILPNRGAIVTALSMEEIAAAIEVLVGLEALAAERACERITDAQVAEVVQLHAKMEEAFAAGELMSYFRLNQAIHQHIVDAAGNPVLSRIYAVECKRIQRYRYAGNLEPQRWASAVEEHRAMLQALHNRSGAVLREMLREHHHRGWATSSAVLQKDWPAEEVTKRRPSRKSAAVG